MWWPNTLLRHFMMVFSFICQPYTSSVSQHRYVSLMYTVTTGRVKMKEGWLTNAGGRGARGEGEGRGRVAKRGWIQTRVWVWLAEGEQEQAGRQTSRQSGRRVAILWHKETRWVQAQKHEDSSLEYSIGETRNMKLPLWLRQQSGEERVKNQGRYTARLMRCWVVGVQVEVQEPGKWRGPPRPH